jgi:hypothetical protein
LLQDASIATQFRNLHHPQNHRVGVAIVGKCEEFPWLGWRKLGIFELGEDVRLGLRRLGDKRRCSGNVETEGVEVVLKLKGG